MALWINDTLSLPEEALTEQFFSASTPGGQHANKAATGVRLLCDTQTPALPPAVRRRLLVLAAGAVNSEGILAVTSTRFRERERNRMDAREKLQALVLRATHKPKFRVATRPSMSARKKRTDEKSKRGQTKRLRRKVGHGDD